MKLIELHILQSFPVTCLNRDDVGAPKTAVFGGVPRARVSSQCWKRAIRELASNRMPASFAGVRGHFIAAELEDKLRATNMPDKKAKEAAEAIATFLGERDKKHESEHKTSVMLFLSPLELEAIAAAAAADFAKTKSVQPKKGDVKKALDAHRPTDRADIAIFGRMVASDHTLMLEGAGLFSHAISTHGASSEVDFFSAVDELKPEESEGAGHIGTLEFNSACYYRYVGLNTDLLGDKDHLGCLAPPDLTKVADAFLRASIEAVPNARHNSMFGLTPPSYVLGLAREGQPVSLANAFEEPVRSQSGFVDKSREKLDGHWKLLKQTYGLSASEECDIPACTLDQFMKKLLDASGLGHA